MHPATDKRVFDKEAVSLQKAGFNVVHVCPGMQELSYVKDGIEIRQYSAQRGLWGRLRQLRKLYRLALYTEADAYHCNEVDSWAIGVCLRLFRGKKCVFDVHEDYPSTFSQSRFPRFAQPAIAWAVRAVFRCLTPFTDRLVLAKESVRYDFKSSIEKQILVRNFTPLSGISTASSRVMRDRSETMRIVHLGLFSKVRGWPQVLDALARVDVKATLEVIGEINDGSSDEFFSRVRELGLEDRVSVTEWLPFAEAFQKLLESHVGIIAFQPHIQNHVFAMPHKLFDYMGAGMAVLMPKQAVEVAPIILESKCGILIDPSDPLDIARGISLLLEDPHAAHEMGIRGREAVLTRYNWEAEAKILIEMYRGMKTK